MYNLIFVIKKLHKIYSLVKIPPIPKDYLSSFIILLDYKFIHCKRVYKCSIYFTNVYELAWLYLNIV